MQNSGKSVRVFIDKRVFIVDFNDDGEPLRIKERKIYAKGSFYESAYNAPYWSAKHHKVGSNKTLPARIIAQDRSGRP